MADRPAFQDRQFAFAAHIRDPDGVAVPAGIDNRRMAVYRDLFFNNLRNLLARNFPVLVRLVGDAEWRRLVRAFLREHRAHTPYFLELPREFVTFLQRSYRPQDNDPPFLAELAHYEYAELEAAVAESPAAPPSIDPDGDLVAGVPVLADAFRVHTYRWPVHRVSPDYRPDAPLNEPVHLAIFRQADDKVRFLEVNPLTARLLQGLGDNAAQRAGHAILEQIAGDIGYPDPDAFVQHGARTLCELRDCGLLRGTLVS